MNEVINSHPDSLIEQIFMAREAARPDDPWTITEDSAKALAHLSSLEALMAERIEEPLAQYNDGLITASELVQKIVWEGTR